LGLVYVCSYGYYIPGIHLVSRGQTAFFRFSLWWRKKGSGDLTIGFAGDKIVRFWRALIADDKSKRGVKELWDYVANCTYARPVFEQKEWKR